MEGKMMRLKTLLLALLVVLLSTSGLLANGLNLNGFGARAASMGGAFVGLADDFTAVFWNPAGLAQLKKGTFGLTGDLLIPTGTYTLDTFSMQTNTKYYPAGLIGLFQPIGDRIVVGLGAYTLSGLGANWNNTGLEAALVYPYPTTIFTPPIEPYDWNSMIGSIVVSPAIAVKITDQIFFGATFNASYGFFKVNEWGEFTTIPLDPPVLLNFGQATLDVKGWGFGATFGILFKPNDMVSFGVTYRTPSTFKLSGTESVENLALIGPFIQGSPTIPDTSNVKMNVTSPMWIAGGVSLKPVKSLTLDFDLQWTNWKKINQLAVLFEDPVWNAIGKTEQDMAFNWADKLQIRGGLEYKIGDFALRGGYYYDPAPAPDETMNILIPGFTYNTITVGAGYHKGGFGLDLGFEYLMGEDRTIAPSEDNIPGFYQFHILVPEISLTFGW
jgi:long-chain fatty acid transport protein